MDSLLNIYNSKAEPITQDKVLIINNAKVLPYIENKKKPLIHKENVRLRPMSSKPVSKQ